MRCVFIRAGTFNLILSSLSKHIFPLPQKGRYLEATNTEKYISRLVLQNITHCIPAIERFYVVGLNVVCGVLKRGGNKFLLISSLSHNFQVIKVRQSILVRQRGQRSYPSCTAQPTHTHVCPHGWNVTCERESMQMQHSSAWEGGGAGAAGMA